MNESIFPHLCYHLALLFFFIFAILVGIEDILLAFEHRGFLGSSNGKQSACNAGDLVSISGLGRSPGEENGKPLQSSLLENSLDRGACSYSLWDQKESNTTE